MKTLHEEIEILVKPVAIAEGIINAEVNIVGCNEKGDGYLGVVTVVEVKGTNKSLKLVVKTSPKNEELRKQMPIREAFDREINFYTKVYPAFRKFQLEHSNVRPFISVAKCYTTCTDFMAEALVFQNLKEVGFDVYDRKKTMDKRHVAFVLEEYGRLHALSYALRDQDNEQFRRMTFDMADVFQLFLDNADFDKLMSGLLHKVVGLREVNDNIKVKAALNDYVNSYIEFFKTINSKEADRYAVILHGDCWCNNMMFEYEDPSNPNVPTSMRLIDWQLQKLGSPVLDLSYYLYACADKDVFNDLDDCLKIYHDSLSNQLKKLGSEPEKMLPFRVLKDQWQRFAKYGMTLAILVIRIMLSDREEVPDLLAAAENGESVLKTFNFESKNEEEYNRRVTDIVLHCYKNKIIV